MARCCGCKLIGGDELWMKKKGGGRAQPSSPYKDDGEMLWVGNVVHNLLPHIKMMARCCGCKLIGGDELWMKKKKGGNVVHTTSSPYKDDGEMLWVGECRAQPSSPYKDDGEMLWVGQCRAQPSSPYKDDGEMLWVGQCRAQPSSLYKDDGDGCGWGECRAQPSSPYKDDGEMLWV
ncbi:hypothetical protein KSF78_0009648 [Schistosoma japonicum]|nr:hypothetical protein KSF78_0009648 [Schistosoma japonicum]